MRPLLRLREVEARYGRFTALSNVSMIVPEGSVVALLGPNGVGKTTLLRVVSGMLKPTAGTITFDGTRIDGRSDHAIARMGLAHIPEGRGIFPALTVRENLLMQRLTGSPSDGLARVFELFPRLHDRIDQTAGTLSGGEQQMLALARAVINRPRLLMVDELSHGLAPVLVELLFETLQKIRAAGTTVLLVEQYVRYALRLSDIAVILHKGKLAFIGEPDELQHGGALAEAYLGGTQAASASATATAVARPTRTRAGPRPRTPRSSRS
jgi:branched-chain amino acid transport system ATP-binding protein